MWRASLHTCLALVAFGVCFACCLLRALRLCVCVCVSVCVCACVFVFVFGFVFVFVLMGEHNN